MAAWLGHRWKRCMGSSCTQQAHPAADRRIWTARWRRWAAGTPIRSPGPASAHPGSGGGRRLGFRRTPRRRRRGLRPPPPRMPRAESCPRRRRSAPRRTRRPPSAERCASSHAPLPASSLRLTGQMHAHAAAHRACAPRQGSPFKFAVVHIIPLHLTRDAGSPGLPRHHAGEHAWQQKISFRAFLSKQWSMGVIATQQQNMACTMSRSHRPVSSCQPGVTD